MTKYQRAKERARNKAQKLQQINFTSAQSWEEVNQNSAKVYELGKRYGLIKEFRENGII